MREPIDSIPGRLLRHAVERPDTVALTRLGPEGTPTSTLSYGELWHRTGSIADELARAEAVGRPVLIPERNGIDYVVAYLACIRAGAIAVTAHAPRANDRSGRLESIIKDAGPVRALASTSTVESCLEIGDPSLKSLQFIATDQDAYGTDDLDEPPGIDPDREVMFQYTSGSTSDPRAVRVTHGNLVANLDAMSSLFYREGSVGTVCWLPLFHDMGLIGLVMTSLVNGITANLMAPEEFVMRPVRWLRAISRTRSEHSGGPNFAFNLCVERTTPEDRAELDLRCWKSAMNGAEAVRPETIERFVEAFGPCGFDVSAMQPCYGLAESTLVVSTRRPGARLGLEHIASKALAENRLERCPADQEDAVAITTCGAPIPGHAVAILDEDDGFMDEEGGIGEICVRGPSVTHGYRGGEEEDRFPESIDGRNGPWLRTGDLGGFIDGELVIAGRLKDLIIVGGSNHHPQDLERTAGEAHEAVDSSGCAAFAVPDAMAHGGEGVVLLVELSREQMRATRKDEAALRMLKESITAAVRSAISRDHAVALSECVLLKSGSIPKTTSGKVRRGEAATSWREGTLPVI